MMYIGLAYVKDTGIIFCKNLRQRRSDTRMILSRYIDEYEFELSFFHKKYLLISWKNYLIKIHITNPYAPHKHFTAKLNISPDISIKKLLMQ